MAKQLVRIGHSPDADDAFMFYGLAAGLVPAGDWHFEHVLQDIQTLNERALRGDLEVTAVSFHAYPFVADSYALTSCGCSMGDGYGPLVVSRRPLGESDLAGLRIAVPGTRTTAFLALSLFLGKDRFQPVVMAFDRIMGATTAGEVDAGLIIHEGQLTFAEQQLHRVVDLGAWWHDRTGLPLPLGGNCIRRDLGRGAMEEITAIIRASIRYALEHRAAAVEHALAFGRGITRDTADRFIGMYVNDWTLDYGDRGRQAVAELLEQAAAAGATPRLARIDYIG